jgi:predicted aspartyl protease
MLVDTGATTLGLPRFMIRSLGLRRLRGVQARTAAGEIVVGIYKDASLTIEGRTGTFDCLELADESAPLLGCIPMEFLGIEPDLKNRTIRLLPEWGPDSYFLT